MKITLCTIGFTGKSAEEFFRQLAEADVRKVVDVRERRIGQLSGFAKYPDIEFFLRRIGKIEYQHEPLFAPSPEIRKAYRKSDNWPAYEAAFLPLMRERGVPEKIDARTYEGKVALLCSEAGPEQCHRRLVAELLAEHWRAKGHHVEVTHLVLPARAKKSHAKKS